MKSGPARATPGVQIGAGETVCPACRAALEFFPVLHHMICAYIGPEYDFTQTPEGFTCPKCRRGIVSGDDTCEIVGTSARCGQCGKEWVVAPPPVAA